MIVHDCTNCKVEGATLDNDDDDEEEGGASSTLLLALIDQPWVYCPPNTTLLRSMIITMTMIIMMVTMRMVSIQHKVKAAHTLQLNQLTQLK